jgi:hypothetical protein
MKKALIFFLILLCGGVIVYGNLHWKSMTSGSASDNEEVEEKQEAANNEEEEVSSSAASGEHLALASNWPEGARSVYEQKLEAGEKFTIALVGSDEMETVEEGWNDIVTSEVKDTYGDTVSLESLSYNKNTLDFVRDETFEEVSELNPDLVVFEPFVFKDNGVVIIEDSLQNIDTIIEEVDGASFVITPPQPVYQPALYATQVEELKGYANANGIPYIDHWSHWPDVEDEEIKNYLDEVSSPNEEGHELWAKGVIEYLVARP